MFNFAQIFNFKKKYHFVDKCPRCGSYKTGYVVRRSTEKAGNKAIYEGLINGELVEPELGVNFGDIENNLFCHNCGSRWYGDIEIKYLDFEERIAQRELRGINEDLITDYSILSLDSFERRQAIKIMNREKRRVEKARQKAAIKQENAVNVKKDNVKIKK